MKIVYTKTENVALKDLNEFQGALKELTEDNFNKLWKSIKESGFAEPFVVWNCEKDKKIYVLGGNERLRVLTEKKKLGEKIPAKFPCNFVECDSKWAAKKILLALASQYGRVTDEGLYEYAIENDFDQDFLKDNFNFPGLDLDVFCDGYFEDLIENEPKEKEVDENIETKNECPKCGYVW